MKLSEIKSGLSLGRVIQVARSRSILIILESDHKQKTTSLPKGNMLLNCICGGGGGLFTIFCTAWLNLPFLQYD